jgi:hypothetical protein
MSNQFTRTIHRQDTVVTVNGLSRIPGGQATDVANFDTVIHLSNPEAQELNLILPSVTNDPQTAYIRLMEDIHSKKEFNSPVSKEELEQMPEEVQKMLAEVIEEKKKEWEKVQTLASSFSVNKVKLKQGDQELKFFLQKEFTQNPNDGTFELSFIAPLSNFQLQGGMSLIVVLPVGAQLVGEPVVTNPTGGPTPQYHGMTNTVGRPILQWTMQYDPIFTIKYRY